MFPTSFGRLPAALSLSLALLCSAGALGATMALMSGPAVLIA